jgi:anti-sigma regulatory factor (Ser/Thr protein kinase)/ActR/RegA family two-component response regulator
VADRGAPPVAQERRILLVGGDDALAAELAASERLSGMALERAHGNADAIRRIRARDCDLVLTDPATPIREDLAFVEEVSGVRRSTRIIVLAPSAPQADVIAALRLQAFACFSAPFDVDELAMMAADAVRIDDWRTGIQVISGLPDWISLRVSSRQVTADRLVRFMTEYRSDLAESERTDLMTAFREMLLNAMEHGAGFDPEKVIEVSAARTRRAIVFHFRDPGPGFDRADLAHAAVGHVGVGPMAHFERRTQLGMRPGGFGILLVRHLVDEVVYNERGNEVLLIKYTDR